MKILVLGGTGAMGQELVPLLALDAENKIVVTSRKKIDYTGKIEYIQGNAKRIEFLRPMLECGGFDVIIDFMLYSVDEFKCKYELLLNSCKQYIFFSSARVYAVSDSPVKENSARLLDVSTDKDFLKEGEYSLTKAKEEDILKDSGLRNWVIIRPYKTYCNNRLQLGVLELEQWLYRALSGKTVVVPGNIEHLHTSLTDSKDTAKILKHIIGNQIWNGETIQIANPERITWGDVIKVYSQCIEEKCGKRMKVHYMKDTSEIELLFNNKYRIKYDGLVDRTFDDSKIASIVWGGFPWTPLCVGLSDCIKSALEQNELIVRDYSVEGMYDRLTGERTPLREISGNKNRIKYLLHRVFSEKTIRKIKKFVCWCDKP